jgi:hypothetical protein
VHGDPSGAALVEAVASIVDELAHDTRLELMGEVARGVDG